MIKLICWWYGHKWGKPDRLFEGSGISGPVYSWEHQCLRCYKTEDCNAPPPNEAMTEMTNEQLLSLADLMVEQGSTFETPKYFSRLVELARIGASVMPRPRLSMEMLASLEETWEAMEAVGEDPKDAAAIEALKRADVVMVPREAIQQMAERLDSGGRRLETAVKACEEVEAQLRALIDKPKEYQPLFSLTVEEKEHAPHEIRKRTDGYGDPAKGEYNAFLADDGSDIPCD